MREGAELSRELITTLLDLAALLLVAFGAAAALFPLIGWASALAGGAVLYGGARVIEWVAEPRRAPAWFKRLSGGERR